MLEEYKNNQDQEDIFDEMHINDCIRSTKDGRVHKAKYQEEIIKNAELKLKEKGRNTTNRPIMLDEARKYFNTQGIQIESTKSVKNNESVHSKITKVNQNCKEEIKNYDIISGNNFTLGLKAKFSSNQSSNKNYVKRSKDQAKYSSAKTIEVDKKSNNGMKTDNSHQELSANNFQSIYKECNENVDENSKSLNSKERKHSASSETFSSLNGFKDVQKVSSVVKVEKLMANNKRSSNRMILYLVDKDPSDGQKRSKVDCNPISNEITNETTARIIGGPRLKYSSNKVTDNGNKLMSRNSKMQIMSGGDVSNDKEK